MQFFRNVSSSCKPLWNLCTRIDTDIMEMWFIDCSCIKGGEKGHCRISQTLTGTTIAGSGGCVCSSMDTGWYSGSFESMVVSF